MKPCTVVGNSFAARASRCAAGRLGPGLAGTLAALLLCWSGALWAAQQCTAHSAVQRQALVELYTSEGCSSCPPADQWLGQAGADDHAAHFIPLALHVDYWDGLGWRDRFAQHRFTERQQSLSE